MKEPVRSIDDASLPESFRQTLAAHPADRPSPERLARIAKSLELSLGMPLAAAGGLPARRSLAARLSRVWPWAGFGAAVFAMGVWWAAPSPAAPSRAPSPPAAALQTAPVLPQPAPAPVPAALEPESTAPPPSPRTSSPARAQRVAKPKLDSAPEDPSPIAPRGDADASEELRLLQRAQQQLTAAPARALSLAGEHAARYPAGMFRQERELIAIVALLRRGQRAEAEARAAQFREAFRDSVHASRLDALLRADNADADPAPKRSKEATSW